jgi:hypothetical protein
MSSLKLEERVAILESEVAQLRQQIQQTSPLTTPWWEKVLGIFSNNSAFDKAMNLGREYRDSMRSSSTRKDEQ